MQVARAFIGFGALSTIWECSKDFLREKFFIELIIESKHNPKAVYAILRTIEEKCPQRNRAQINDGSTPQYTISEGTYSWYTPQLGWVYVTLEKELIRLWQYRYTPRFAEGVMYVRNLSRLQEYFESCYSLYTSTQSTLSYFTSDQDHWQFPIFRSPRNVQNPTTEMQQVMEDVDTFRRNRTVYEAAGRPYRRGLFLEGDVGTGKTTCIEMIAQKHDMSVFLANLNSGDMTDVKLVNLISGVPRNSILVFEEIDRQLETLFKNPRNHVSIGGLLTALDGPQRLSEGVIVILTANNANFLPPNDMLALLRPGRIDHVHHLRSVFS